MEGYNTYNFFYILFVLQSFTNQCCTTIQPIISHQAIQLVLCQIWLNLKKQTNKKHCNYERSNKCTSMNGSEFDIYSPSSVSNLWIQMEGYNTYNFFLYSFCPSVLYQLVLHNHPTNHQPPSNTVGPLSDLIKLEKTNKQKTL